MTTFTGLLPAGRRVRRAVLKLLPAGPARFHRRAAGLAGRRDVIGAADRQVGRVRVRVDTGVPPGIGSADGFVDPLLDPITSWLISFHYGT